MSSKGMPQRDKKRGKENTPLAQLQVAASEVSREVPEEPGAQSQVGKRQQQHDSGAPARRPYGLELYPVAMHELDELASLGGQQVRAEETVVLEAVRARTRRDRRRTHQPQLHLPHQSGQRHLAHLLPQAMKHRRKETCAQCGATDAPRRDHRGRIRQKRLPLLAQPQQQIAQSTVEHADATANGDRAQARCEYIDWSRARCE
eukprot:scaffold293_cov121-Isochrysis_galbana.AAC.12